MLRQGPIDESLLSLKRRRAAARRDIIIECRIDDIANNNSAAVRRRVALRLFSLERAFPSKWPAPWEQRHS